MRHPFPPKLAGPIERDAATTTMLDGARLSCMKEPMVVAMMVGPSLTLIDTEHGRNPLNGFTSPCGPA